MPRKFVLCDLDGTLLDLPNGLSEECLARLNALLDQGLQFSIATGRDLKKAKKAVRGLKLAHPVILTNGALMADLEKEKILEVTYIGTPIVQEILKWSEEMGLDPIVFITYDPESQTLYSLKGKWGKKGIKLLQRTEIEQYLTLQVVSIQFHAEKKTLIPLMTRIQQNFQNEVNIIFIEDVSYRSFQIKGDWFWLEMNSIEAGKDRMMHKLAEKLGLNLQNFVVFGDNLNDLEMMESAGISVAVGNAHNDVKKIANYITLDNNECGVVEFLEKNREKFI